MLLLIVSSSAFSQVKPTDDNANVTDLIEDLYKDSDTGTEVVGGGFNIGLIIFTEPMLKILKIGTPPAQEALITRLNDERIKERVILLLGGLGDERAVAPIIDAMIAKSEIDTMANAKRINHVANIALTNITVADVIYHHGGGILIEYCPNEPKECWMKWWQQNKDTFSVKTIKQSRRYSSYPNYGIYRQD
jgi:hypothetical protein